MAQELLVLSPEKTVLAFDIARIPSRLWAQLLDFLILCVFLFILVLMAVQILGWMGMSHLGTGAALLLISLGPFIYFIVFEGFWNGQTLGKKAMNIRVRMADGTPLTFAAALGRNFLRVADFLPFGYFLGLLAIFTNPRSQRLGDMIANTVVMVDRRTQAMFAPAPYILGVHPFEEHVGDLRGMTGDEYAALRRLCDRFPELPTGVQNKLIQEVWEPLAHKFHIEPIANVHPVYLAEAVVMKYGRSHGML